MSTEREIEAALRAVPLICGNDFGIGVPDYPAMARAVVERVVTPKNTDCLSAGCMEDRVHALAKELGFMEELQARLADRDARLAQLEERVTALQGDGSGHLHRCARVNGAWACDKACRVADSDARFARLVEVLKQADRIITEVIGRERGDIISTLGIELRAISVLDELRAALADAVAGKE